MLNIFRKNTKIIIWSVVLCFALWGGFSVGTQFQKQGRYAGEVFGKNITFQEYDSFYKAAQIFSVNGTPADDAEVIKTQAWQNIILYHTAKKQGIKVSNDEVRTELLRLLKSQGLESFDAKVYENWLQRALRTTPKEFEGQVKNLLLIRKLISKVREENPFEISPEDALQRFLLDKNLIDAEILLFDSEDSAKNFMTEKNLTVENWAEAAEAVKADPKNFIATGKASLFAIKQYWQLDEATLDQLIQSPLQSILGPIALQKRYGIFLIKDKTTVTADVFTEQTKQDYLAALKNFETQKYFMSWYLDIFRQAKFKDYLPAPVTAEEPAAPEAE